MATNVPTVKVIVPSQSTQMNGFVLTEAVTGCMLSSSRDGRSSKRAMRRSPDTPVRRMRFP